MNYFNTRRFTRIFLNDLLLQARKLGIATVALMGLGLVIYLTNITGIDPSQSELSDWMYPTLLLCGGLVFASMIFNDMHNALERFHYLTLPCSNLERFLGRYLLTAPLFIVYVTVAYVVFEFIANLLCAYFFDITTIPFDPFAERTGYIVLAYLATHTFAYTGAIYFRSFALVRTGLTLMLLWLCFGLLFFATMRILYWEHFVSFFEMDPNNPVYLNFDFMSEDPTVWHKTGAFLFCSWILLLGFLGLKDHEASNGL